MEIVGGRSLEEESGYNWTAWKGTFDEYESMAEEEAIKDYKIAKKASKKLSAWELAAVVVGVVAVLLMCCICCCCGSKKKAATENAGDYRTMTDPSITVNKVPTRRSTPKHGSFSPLIKMASASA